MQFLSMDPTIPDVQSVFQEKGKGSIASCLFTYLITISIETKVEPWDKGDLV